ncbi:MAG: S-layer homology domain-containing protein [Romboutsia sp.]
MGFNTRKKHYKMLSASLAISLMATSLCTIDVMALEDGQKNNILENVYTESDEKKYQVIDVTDFGADMTGRIDSAEAIIKAIEHAKTIEGPTKIYFPKGEYQVWPEKTLKRELYVSNTVGTNQSHKMKNIGILIENMNDVIVDGGGSQFIFHGFQTAFASIGSENVRFENFSFDYENPKVVDITVEETGVKDGKGYRTIYIPETYDYKINGTSIQWLGEKSPTTGNHYWSGTNSFNYTQAYNYKTGETKRMGNPVFSNVSSINDLGNNRVQIKYTDANTPNDLGMCYQMRETTRDTPGAFFWESKNVVVDTVNINYLHGFGFVGQFSENITVNNCNFQVRDNVGRTTAGFADYIQMSGIKGKVKISNTSFSNPHDDPINVHGTYLEVKEKIAPNKVKVRYMHNETAGFPQFYVGDEVEFFTKQTMLPVQGSTAKVVEVDGPSGTSSDKNLTDIIITLDKDIPDEIIAGNTHVVENITYTPEVEIINNRFQETPTRGILVTTRKPVLIENNYFDAMGMASIYISSDAHQWYESGPTDNVTIRNNTFDRPEGPVIYFDPTNQQYNEKQPVHNNIMIEDNVFNIKDKTVLSGKSVGDLTFQNNIINRYDENATLNISTDKENLDINGTTKLQANGTGSSFNNPLFNFNGAGNINIKDNKYDNGLNLKINTSSMNNPSESINIENDNLKINQDNKLSNAENIKYFSSNEDVVTVSDDGTVTAVGEGSATVVAYSGLGRKYKSNPVIFNVGSGQPGYKVEDINIEGYDDSNSSIKSLNVSGVEGMPKFNIDENFYIANKSTNNKTMTITAEAESKNAKLVVLQNGRKISETTGTYNGTIDLLSGGNYIQIYSIAEDGISTSMYRVSVIRQEDNTATLSYLTVDGKVIDDFELDNFEYGIKVKEDKESIKIGASKTYNKSNVTISKGNKSYNNNQDIPLDPGTNTIYVRVNSENYAINNLYKIVVTRSSKANASLESLDISDGITLSPVFDPAVTEYTASIGDDVDKFVLSANAAESKAKISVLANGVDTDHGDISERAIYLTPGENIIKVRVTSEAGDVREYSITANKKIEDMSEQWTIDSPMDGYVTISADDSITVETATDGGMWATGNSIENIILTDVIDKENFTITAKMDGITKSGYEEAGIIIYKDRDNYTAIQRKHANGNPNIMVVNESNGSPTESSDVQNLEGESIYFKLVKTGNKIEGFYSVDNITWVKVKEVSNSNLDENIKVGIMATGSTARTPFTFSEFKVDENTVSFLPEEKEEPQDFIVGVKDVNLSTLVGEIPKLQSTVDVTYLDGKTSKVSVDWDSITEEQVKTEGQIKINGSIEGTNLKARATITVKKKSEPEKPSTGGGGSISKPLPAPSGDWKNHWAESEIQKAMSLDWVVTTSKFRPNDSITRAEFVKILNKSLGLTRYNGNVFEDTVGHWAEREIDIAITNGVCIGKSDKSFKPDDKLTREEAATMISNYKKIADQNHDKLNKYLDKKEVSSWALDAVEGVIEKGYMQGKTKDKFAPKANITRAESVAMLSRVR